MSHRTLADLARHTALPLPETGALLGARIEQVLDDALQICAWQSDGPSAAEARAGRRHVEALSRSVANARALDDALEAWLADVSAHLGEDRGAGPARGARALITVDTLAGLGERGSRLLDAALGSGLIAEMRQPDGTLFSPRAAQGPIVGVRLATRDGNTPGAIHYLKQLHAALRPMSTALPVAMAAVSERLQTEDAQLRRAQLSVLEQAAAREGGEARRLVFELAEAQTRLGRTAPMPGCESPAVLRSPFSPAAAPVRRRSSPAPR